MGLRVLRELRGEIFWGVVGLGSVSSVPCMLKVVICVKSSLDLEKELLN